MDFKNVKKINIEAGEVKQIAINDIVVWKSGYENLVPTAIDTDKSVYNGTGYINGYRLSSSGALKEQGNTVTTGFIKANKNDVIRMAGTQWNVTAGYNYFTMYDANFKGLGHINFDGTGSAATKGWSYANMDSLDADNTRVYVENGVARFDIALLNSANFAYIRISAYGSGSNMVVTVNEEIV